MISNFSFLQTESKYAEILTACVEAEKSIIVSHSACALQTRRALEIAVKWLYRYESELMVPYQDNLSSLIHDYKFKQLVDPKLFPRIKLIIKIGNIAAHTVKPITRLEIIQSLKSLHDFISWLDYSYSAVSGTKPFNTSFLQDGETVEKKTRKIQAEMAAKEAEWLAEKKKLEGQLKSEKERKEHTEKRKEHSQSRKYTCEDISEFKTRKIYIDVALKDAGWDIGTNCLEEVEVSGMPNTSGTGYVDYVLYADNGKPMAVIEAKRSSKDPKIGKQQAKLYADCLEKEHGVRPFIFYANGFETYFWDDTEYPDRLVFNFFTKEVLDWYYYRKENKKAITTISINDKITNRPYQKIAIQKVCDALEEEQRKALLVMATGSGKTRVAISIVDVLQQNGWVKNVLFLADRRELVKQAKKNFVELMPHLSICNLLDSKDDPTSRMVFSTYPTIMNAIDDAKTKDGARLFTPGHFDLIIIDESHRSIYKKYQDIFTYFDGFLLGLTATPKSDIDKNTYSIFDLEDGVPTFAYELGKAIKEEYLVPYRTIESSTKFIDDGIRYDDLSDEEKEQWEDTFDDDKISEKRKEISSSELNTFLFNDNTVDQVIINFMEKGIKVNAGDTIGKTIIFAKNTKHADFILERFDKLYPHYAGKLAAPIYNGIKYVDKVYEDFETPYKYPQIAISVDMLDTGVDIPSIVNLVFFKKVRSKAKFWQMIGRGTRLCEDLLGIGHDKESFLIFDHCSNFEFFRENKEGIEAKNAVSITEKIYLMKVQIAKELQHLDYQTDKYIEYRNQLVTGLHQAVANIDEDGFSAKMRIKYVHKYKNKEMWDSISDEMIQELRDNITPLIVPSEEHELTKRFDQLIYSIQLTTLKGTSPYHGKIKVISTAIALEEKGNLPQVKRHAKLIKWVQTDEYWDEADIMNHETVRTALRELMILLEKENAKIYYTSFEDEMDTDIKSKPGEYNTGEFQDYQKKVNDYLKNHLNETVIHKIRTNKPIGDKEVKHLENLLWHELGTEVDYHKEFGDEPLVKLVAKLVGLEQAAAQALFSDFLSDQSLNSHQMEFVKLIVEYIVQNGMIDKETLNEHPFDKHGNIRELFKERIDTVHGIVKQIDKLNKRLNPTG